MIFHFNVWGQTRPIHVKRQENSLQMRHATANPEELRYTIHLVLVFP